MTEFVQWLNAGQQWLVDHQVLFVSLSYLILGTHLLQNMTYVLELLLAAQALFSMRMHQPASHTGWLANTDIAQPISMLIPARNEGQTIVASVQATLALEYPSYEVVVINDGSTDDTLAQLIDAFALEPSTRAFEYQVRCSPIRALYRSAVYHNLWVVDKISGGHRADALNAGLNVARYPTFCAIHAGAIIEPSALLAAVQPFINDPQHTIAVSGAVRIVGGCCLQQGALKEQHLPHHWLGVVQIIEYLRTFLLRQLAWSRLGLVTTPSGAVNVLQTEVAIRVGGFSAHPLGDDHDLMMRMHRHMREHHRPYRVFFVPEPVCWIRAPESIQALRQQRLRWQRNTWRVFLSNIDMLANPRYGRLGLLAMPLTLLNELIVPLAEIIGLILLPLLYVTGVISLDLLLAFIGVTVVMGVFFSLMALSLQAMTWPKHHRATDLAKLMMAAVIENLGYRQLTALWRLVGFCAAFCGQRRDRPAAIDGSSATARPTP